MMRGMIFAGVAGLSLLTWADYRGWSAFEPGAQVTHTRSGASPGNGVYAGGGAYAGRHLAGGHFGGGGHLYHK